MIKYDPLWQTLKAKNISQYQLIKDYGIDKAQLQRLRQNMVVKTIILNRLCQILDCRIEDIMEYVPENEKQMQSKTGDECAYEIPNLVRYNCKGSTCTDKFIIVLERECLYGFI